MSGWSWEPVVERMQQYRCLVPDLPHDGKSFEQGPFEMARAATAVAELIRSRADAGRAHVVGLHRGAGWAAASGDRSQNSSTARCCPGQSSTRCRG